MYNVYNFMDTQPRSLPRSGQIKTPFTLQENTKSDEGIKRLEDHRRLDHAVVVEFAQVLDAADAALVEFGQIELEAHAHVFQHAVDHSYGHVLL